MTGQVWTLDSIAGTLFCGTDKGAYIIRGTRAEKIEGTEGTWKFEPIHPGNDRILACDYSGLLVLERRAGTYAMRNRIKGTSISTNNMLVDNDGSIWLSHWQKGIYHLWLDSTLTAVTRQEYFHKDKGLLMDEGNRICRIGNTVYVSCVDGFYRYDLRTRSLVHDKDKSNIFGEYGVALQIYENPNHDLWAYKPGYLAKASRQKDGTNRIVRPTFAQAAMEMNIGSGNMCFINEKQIICNGHNGFFVLDGTFEDKSTYKTTYIRGIVATNTGDTILYTRFFRDEAINTVRIPHALNSLRIEFVHPEYRVAKAITYTCLLEGYDKEWSISQTSTCKEYTHLRKGKYTFRVKATNTISGQTDEASITIVILPAWYETWWAYIVYALLLGAAIYYAAAYVRKRTDREKERISTEKERQLKEQQAIFDLEKSEKEKELFMLRNKQMEYDMKQKSSELADSTMNLIRKNDLLQIIDENVQELCDSVRKEEPKNKIIRRINDIRHDIQASLNDDANWDKFEENFNLVYDNFMQQLIKSFPDLKKKDRKLCAYLRMGLSSKEMASLLNTSVRSIETARYRLRKKLELDAGANLTDFIQQLAGTD